MLQGRREAPGPLTLLQRQANSECTSLPHCSLCEVSLACCIGRALTPAGCLWGLSLHCCQDAPLLSLREPCVLHCYYHVVFAITDIFEKFIPLSTIKTNHSVPKRHRTYTLREPVSPAGGAALFHVSLQSTTHPWGLRKEDPSKQCCKWCFILLLRGTQGLPVRSQATQPKGELSRVLEVDELPRKSTGRLRSPRFVRAWASPGA